MLRKLLEPLLIFSLLNCFHDLSAQVIDNTVSFRSVHQKSYFRFHYDNDYFTKADHYYSQGITLEYVHPGLKHNPLSKLLIRSQDNYNRYGVSFDLFGYTPTNVRSDSILPGDRPFAAAMTIRSFVCGIDSIHRKRISSAIVIGVIGPLGQGYEIHAGIHRWLNNPLPHGWENQIHNDVVLDYQLSYEKQLFADPGHFSLNAVSELRLGTLNDKINGGFNFMAGNFSEPFQKRNSKKVEYYFYGQARANFIAYDASMQGGMFNKNSPYTIAAGDISRLTFQADAGIIVNFKKIYLSYTQSFLSKEFRSGKYHRWGGVSLGFSL